MDRLKENIIKMLKSKSMIIAIIMLACVIIYDINLGKEAVVKTGEQIWSTFLIVPIIFILIGLIEEWVSKEDMVKFMGEKTGFIGVVIAFLLGTLSAGPLLISFPLAMVMLKKGARYSYVLFFITIWSSAKLPIILFQVESLGLKYTIYSNITLIVIFLIGSFVIEKILGKEEINNMIQNYKE